MHIATLSIWRNRCKALLIGFRAPYVKCIDTHIYTYTRYSLRTPSPFKKTFQSPYSNHHKRVTADIANINKFSLANVDKDDLIVPDTCRTRERRAIPANPIIESKTLLPSGTTVETYGGRQTIKNVLEVCVFACVCVYACIFMCMCIFIYVHTYICIYGILEVCVYVCIYMHVDVHAYICTCLRMYIHMYRFEYGVGFLNKYV